MTPQEQAAFDAMREALEQITPELRGLGIVSDIALSYAGIASSALAAAKAVSDVPETNFGNIVQPQAQEPVAWYSLKVDDTITDAKKQGRMKTQPWNAEMYDIPLYTAPSIELVQQARDDQGLKQFLAAAKDAGITHWSDELTKRLVEAVQPQAQGEAGVIASLKQMVDALNNESDAGWSQDARVLLSKIRCSIGMLAAQDTVTGVGGPQAPSAALREKNGGV